MKNPNGYGGISKLPGNRRKPYRVRLTAGWQYQTDGKPLQKYHTLGYYTSRRAALIALADYNKRPYDLNLQHITLGELYNQWYDKHTVRLSRSSRCSFTFRLVVTQQYHIVRSQRNTIGTDNNVAVIIPLISVTVNISIGSTLVSDDLQETY